MSGSPHRAGAGEKKSGFLHAIKSWGANDLDQRTLAAFLDQFGLMLQVGMRPGNALEALSQNHPSQKLTRVIEDISERIHTGHPLAKSMARHPDVFPSTVLILVRVGETSGDLAGQLRRAGQMVQRTENFLSKVKGAITGPLITSSFCILILFAIVKLVFPRFIAMYDKMDLEFPAISKFVLTVVAMVNHPITLVLIFGLAIACLVYRQKVQQMVFDLLLIFPPTRPVLGSLLCATTSETLATLHAQGVPLHSALNLMAESVPYKSHQAKLRDCKKALVRTGSLHESLLTIDYFPTFFHAMIAIGEETGTLDELLSSSQRMLEQEIEAVVERIANALEPAVTCLMGASMAILFVGMFLPIYGILNRLGAS